MATRNGNKKKKKTNTEADSNGFCCCLPSYSNAVDICQDVGHTCIYQQPYILKLQHFVGTKLHVVMPVYMFFNWQVSYDNNFQVFMAENKQKNKN